MERPLGIVLIAILEVVCGVIAIPGGVVFMANPSSSLQILGLFTLTFGVVGFACAYGLWTFQSWGRMLTLVSTIVGIPLNFAGPAMMGTAVGLAEFISIGISIGIAVIVIAYLVQPSVRARFP